jgi:hypothetical protein
MVALVLIVAAMVVFDLAAILWGADSRQSSTVITHHV